MIFNSFTGQCLMTQAAEPTVSIIICKYFVSCYDIKVAHPFQNYWAAADTHTRIGACRLDALSSIISRRHTRRAGIRTYVNQM